MRPNTRPPVLAVGTLIVVAFLCAACLGQSLPSLVPISIDAYATDPDAVIPSLTTADLTNPRPVVRGEIKGIMNAARGRPPVVPGEMPDLRNDWYWRQRAYPLDTVPYEANLKALEFVASHIAQAAAAPELAWQPMGPNSIDNGLLGLHSCNEFDCGSWRSQVSGRTKAIVFDPTNPSTVYVATATGGVWKSTDDGATYTPLTDNQPSLAFHTLALDPTNPRIVYAGTGEINGHYGVGLLKSTDGGQSWTLLGRSQFEGLVISAIVVHPTNPNTLWVATNLMNRDAGPGFPPRGIFRSTNGGQTWLPMLSCDRCYGISDLVIDNTNPQVLYAGAAATGVFKSTDGGVTWSLLSGLPDRGFSRIELAIGAGSGANVIYAGLSARVQSGQNVVPWGLIFRSGDGGSSWKYLSNAPNYCSSQCDYDNIIAVSPNDPNTVYIGGSFISGQQGWAGMVHKTTNGGQSWQDVTPGTAANRVVHPDMHAITFKPGNTNEVWIGNDGGVFRTKDGGGTWEHRNGNLATLQFVNIGLHPTDPTIVFGGMQDNAKAKLTGGAWSGLDTGDGGWSEIDPFNPSIWYSTRFSMQGSIIQFQRNDKNGTVGLADWQQKADGIDINDRVLFYAPFTLDVKQQGVIYLGTNRLYRTANRGDSWTAISPDVTRGADTDGAISAIAVASDSNTLYTGSSDGYVFVTRNRGGAWTNATAAPLPNRWVSDIAVHPTNPAIAYVAFNGYNSHTPDTPGHVFKTTNAGQSWQDVSAGLPDIPILTITLDPADPQQVYVGSDIGVFISANGGASWTSGNQGLPNVQVYDLELNNTTRHLWAGTYGRGVFRMTLQGPSVTPTPTVTASPTHGPLGKRIYLPVTIRGWRQTSQTPVPTYTPSPTPSASPTLPAVGPAPGEWAGDKTRFGVSGDQHDVWGIRIQVPVPGCQTWVEQSAFVPIDQGRFSFTVDLRENGLWTNEGSFTSRTEAQGTAQFKNMYFGQSCGSWSGTVTWTASWQGSTAPPTATPTFTPRPPTATPSGRSGIYGQFRYRGTGVAGLKLWLRKCQANSACEFDASKAGEALTDANGYYQFASVSDLPSGYFYFVYFLNSSDGGNPGDDRFLWRWFGPNIESYSGGASVSGGDAEIEDIQLTGPGDGTLTLPATFTWSPRGQPGEYYAWELFDPDSGAALCASNPATATSFVLTADDFVKECGGVYDRTYGWFAWVVAGPTWENNQGYGDSYYYASHVIKSSGGATATPTPTRTPVVTPTPSRTPQSASISGRVTNGGSGVSGLNVQLLGCDSSTCAVFGTVVTGSNGSYSFNDLVAPGEGQYFVVRYVNGRDVNPFNANYLSYWITAAVTTLPAANVNLEIRNIALQTPADNAGVYLPSAFTWAGRGVGSDRFTWATSYNGTEFCSQSTPQSGTTFTLDVTAATSCGMYSNTVYGWYVYVTNGTSFDNGFGVSAYARNYTILGVTAAAEGRFPNRANPGTTRGAQIPPELRRAMPQ